MKLPILARIVVLSLLLSVMARAPGAAAGQLLRGQIPPEAKLLQPVDRLDASKRLNLAIGLPLRNRGALTNLLRDLYDPASPRFHQYLTARQFADQFGPTEQDYQAVTRFAQAYGLSVTATHLNRALLDVSGAVADIEKAFHLHMRVYRHPTEARTFYAPDTAPTLDLAVPILGINGLDNFVLPRPMDLNTTAFGMGTNALAYVTGSGPGGYFIGGDFRAAYAPGVALNGSGQSVGLFELDGYYPGDIADYEILAKLPNVTLTNILLDGFNGTPGSENIEVALDIDMAICMAPGLLQVMVYEGEIPNDVLNRMATDNQAKQLSSSWSFGSSTDPVRDQIYQQFAAQGQSMFQASGDSGAYPGSIPAPSDDPNITVVGGTSLTTTGPGGAWSGETTWSGSGGGPSTTFPIPPWQEGVSMSSNFGSITMRNIPDISCVAAVSIWSIAQNGHQGPIGGTSAATPLWAGFMALANQQAAANGRPSIGFINPAIYAIGQGNGYTTAFHDITSGNNTNATSPTNFFAVPGYDLCTGWGSPTGSNLINALTPDPLQITPSAGFVSSGPAGGPLSVTGQTFILTNIGPGSLSWALGGGSSWLNASPGGGTLTAGASASTVTLSLNATASNLTAGSYAATLWFTNLNDRFVQNRLLTLDVVVAPIISQQPASQSVPLGGTAMFNVGTASNALLFFQWEQNGTNLTNGGNISGACGSELMISNVNAGNAGTYRVVVSNAANVAVSDGATLSITSSSPVILTQPMSQTALQGATATLSVTGAGNAPLLYQWQWNTTNLTNGGNISGATSNVLTLMNLAPTNAGSYSVVVSNTLGSTPSSNAILAVISPTAPGVAMSTLYSFTGGMDGGNPNGLMQETNGNLYGTTQAGGSNNSGTIFQMAPAGAVTTLYWFNNASNAGNLPGAALTQGLDGELYGTTESGGKHGDGTAFKTTTNGVLSNLVSFSTGTTGLDPAAAMIQGADGAFYGTTSHGGAYGLGVAFRLTTNGTMSTLVAFNRTNGSDPANLVQAANGILYGTTFGGGANGDGTIFQLTTNGALASLASFNYTNGGSLPYDGLVQTPDGNFLGTTYEGGAYGYGTVFQVSPEGEVATIYAFTGGNDGGHPVDAMIEGSDGNYYGTTAFRGAYDDGTVFRLSPDGTLVTLAQFDGYNGANPQAPLVQGTDGNLYGTTQNGGANGMGVIFLLNLNFSSLQISSQPSNQNAYLGADAVFSVAVIGNPPFFYQWKLDGINLKDGDGFSGSLTPVLTISNVGLGNAGAYSVLVSNAAGSILSGDASLGVIYSPPQITMQPVSQTLLVGGTAVFSIAAVGDLPLSYQWQENGVNLTDGGPISGSATSSLTITNLVETNSGAYSVIINNPIASAPVVSSEAVLAVFAVSAAGTTLADVYSFTGGNDGGIPNGLMLGGNGLLYGTTQNGGMYGDGTIFSLSTNGTLITLASFDGTNGAMPVAGLIQGSNGLFYGTTQLGGSNSAGTVFSMTSGGTINSIYSFASTNDSIDPFTSLIQDAEGNFYGASSNNAMTGDGTIFKLTPGGLLNTFYVFPGGFDGTLPAGALTLGTDGNLYGMTGTGGAYTNGNVFRLTSEGFLTNIYSFTGGTDGSFPSGQLAQGTDGNFYGVTRSNNINHLPFYGTIFKITPGGALTTLFALNPLETLAGGTNPVAGLIQGSDGNFYGTTENGFFINDTGTIIDSLYGTVFRVTPSGTFTTLADFNGTDDGAYPISAMVEGPDGSLYGTTTNGGPGGQGTIFRLTFTSAPQITTQPASQTNFAGGSASFNVTVFGAPQLFYQWQENGANLTDGENVSGSATRMLTLNTLTPADAATYSVIVSNALGSVTSLGAFLTVEQLPAFLTAAQSSSGTIAFTWSAAPGLAYQLQSTTNLASAWSNLNSAVIATNSIMGASDFIVTNGQKFYRVIVAQ
ncbi:MAG: choice-of-anchor tandem repeat GloVer-containing protein [Verrucomicrobiota bacterium]